MPEEHVQKLLQNYFSNGMQLMLQVKQNYWNLENSHFWNREGAHFISSRELFERVHEEVENCLE